MKVKLKSEYTDSINPLHFVLKNRGIKEEDIEKVIDPTEDLMPHWRKLRHIEEGIALLNRHIENGSKIGVYCDSDFDGETSTAIMYKYLINYLGLDKDKVKIIIHKKSKAHGVIAEEVLEVLAEGDLLISPDAGSSDFSEHDILYTKGIDVLVIDHHLAEYRQNARAVIINNQNSPDFPNKSLTGSAMVYLFCKGYSEMFGLEEPRSLLDLAASGMVADRADFSKDLGSYYLMREGLKRENIHSKMLKLVISKNSNMSDDRDLTAKDIGFNVAPMFNSVFRMGTEKELKQMIHGFCEMDYMIYNSRKEMEQSVTEEGYLRAMSVKRRQKKTEDSVMEQIIERIKEKQSDKYKILIVNSTDIIEDSGLNGLIAMKLVREYNKPVLMVKVVGDELKGSARNVPNCPIKSLNNFLTSTGKFECAGHDNAFGVSFKIEDAGTIQEELEDLLKDVDFNDTQYEVDFEWTSHVDTEVIYELVNHSHIWCNGIDEPLIHIKEKLINKNEINFIGATGSTMKVTIDGVDCIKFRLTDSEKHEIATSGSYIKLSLVCTASVNTYNGMDKPQLLIEDFEIEEAVFEDVQGLSLDQLPF